MTITNSTGALPAKHYLFSGSKCLYTKTMINETVLAVVTHTGFNSKKGELIRCLLFPEEINFKFYKDAKKFIIILGCLSVFGTS